MGAEELSIRELDFEATFDVERNALVLGGNADASVATQLERVVTAVHERTGSRRVVVDLHALEFMAASCFNVFVMWVGLINEMPLDARYELGFSINSAVPWQRRSVATLMCFATDVVKVSE